MGCRDCLLGGGERTVRASRDQQHGAPLLPGHSSKDVYARAKRSQRGEFGDPGDSRRDGRQQVYFILLFLVGGIAGSFSNNLESIYIGRIRTCADVAGLDCAKGRCPLAAEQFANHTNVTCPELVTELRLTCEKPWPAWAEPPKAHSSHSHGHHSSGASSGVKTLGDACPLSCNVCKSSKANEDAPSQLAAYSLIESFLGWFGGLGSLWGGLTPMVARCVGQGDEEGAGRLLKMSFVCCFFAAAIAWGIVFPFGGMIVKAAFDPTEATYYYVRPRDDA